MKYCWRRNWGVSLLEALVTCFMLLLVLAIVSVTVRQYRQVMGQLQQHDELMDTALALQRVACELSSCVSLDSTTPLVCQRVDPTNPNRLPSQLTPVPAPMPANWNPLNPQWLEQVSFVLVGSDLMRQVRFADGSGVDTRMAGGLEGFSARLDAPNYLELTARLSRARLVHAGVNLP